METLVPWLASLISLGLGAGLTWIGTQWGAVIESRRKHSKWLRDRQYEAYNDFLATADKWSIRMHDTPSDQRDTPEFFDEMTKAETAVDLLGSEAMRITMSSFRSTILKWDSSPGYGMTYHHLQLTFIGEARAQIDSADSSKRKWRRRISSLLQVRARR